MFVPSLVNNLYQLSKFNINAHTFQKSVDLGYVFHSYLSLILSRGNILPTFLTTLFCQSFPEIANRRLVSLYASLASGIFQKPEI